MNWKILLLLACLLACRGFAQSDSIKFVVIDKIEILGNKKTKIHIIHRELTLKEGDTLRIAQKDSVLMRNRANVFNTNLFTLVEVKLADGGAGKAILKIGVQERWYFFPIPLFELSDRNLNEWWTVYGHDFGRVNYGLRFRQDNFRGRRETLGFVVQFGFTQRFSIVYDIPYLTKSRKLGMTIGGGYAQNRSVAYAAVGNRLAFVTNPSGNARERLELNLAFHYRPAFYAFHTFKTDFEHLWVADTVARLNPNYYAQDQTKLQFVNLSYMFRYDKRDAQGYPLRGYVFKFLGSYLGFSGRRDFEQIEAFVGWGRYIPLGGRWFWDYQLLGQYSYNRAPVFARALGVGYGEQVLRGYELYLVPTQASAIGKQTLKYRLFESVKNWDFMLIPQFRRVPLALYATFYTDAAYSHDQYFREGNFLQNKWLGSVGVGLDLVTYYNSVIRVNYSLNGEGQTRFALHLSTDL